MDVTYRGLEHAGHVLLVALEPEEECGTIFLRLRKGMLAGTVSVSTLAPFATRGTTKLRASLLPTTPGTEPVVLDGITPNSDDVALAAVAESLAQPNSVILVGERAGALPGPLSAVERLADRTGARLAWVPRRAGERSPGAAGPPPGLLPGGRHVTGAAARVDLAAAWGVARVPSTAGRALPAILAAAESGELGGLVVGGVDLRDVPDPALARRAVAAAGFVVQLEVRRSEVTEHADVVLPVAPPVEKAGTFVNWEGRRRPFGQVLVAHHLSDHRVLAALAAEMGVPLGCGTIEGVHAQLTELAGWQPAQAPVPAPAPAPRTVTAGPDQAVLATWKLIDRKSTRLNSSHVKTS